MTGCTAAQGWRQGIGRTGARGRPHGGGCRGAQGARGGGGPRRFPSPLARDDERAEDPAPE